MHVNTRYKNSSRGMSTEDSTTSIKDVLVVFMYLVFTRMPGVSYRSD